MLCNYAFITQDNTGNEYLICVLNTIELHGTPKFFEPSEDDITAYCSKNFVNCPRIQLESKLKK